MATTKEKEKSKKPVKPERPTGKKKKPSGGRKPKVKAEKKKRKIEKVTPPPMPLPKVSGVENPLLRNPRSKSALGVAVAWAVLGKEHSMAELSADQEKLLCEVGRLTGVAHKCGSVGSEDSKTEELKPNEHSARGYIIRHGVKNMVEYREAKGDKVEACMEFAKALTKFVKGGYEETELTKLRSAGLAEYNKELKAEKKAKK